MKEGEMYRITWPADQTLALVEWEWLVDDDDLTWPRTRIEPTPDDAAELFRDDTGPEGG